MSDNDKSRKAANEQLMPCPFCGGKARVNDRTYLVTSECGRCFEAPPTYGIVCEECGAMSSQFYGTMGEAVAAWNNRVLVPQEMSAVEYGDTLVKICASHNGRCAECEVEHPCAIPDKRTVPIVEKWAKEHPEERSEDENRIC